VKTEEKLRLFKPYFEAMKLEQAKKEAEEKAAIK